MNKQTTIFGDAEQIDTGGQYTNGWWLNRRGRFGASDAKIIAAGGDGLATLIKRKRFESAIPEEKYIEWLYRQRDFKSEQMELGSAKEQDNSALFYERTGIAIEPCDMVLVGEHINLSPDGDIIVGNEVIDVEMKNIDSASGWEKYELVEKMMNDTPCHWYKLNTKGSKIKCDEFDDRAMPYFGFKETRDYYQMQMRLALRPNVVKCLYILSCDVVWGDNFMTYEIERDEPYIERIIAGLKRAIKGKTE